MTVTSEPSAHDARSFCLGRRDTMIHNNMTTFNFSTFSNQVLARKMAKSTFIRHDQRRYVIQYGSAKAQTAMDESPTLADPTLGWLLLNDDTHMRKEIHLPRLPEQHSESSNEVGEIFISYSTGLG